MGGTAQGNIGVLSEEAFSREDGDEAAAAVTMAGLGSLVSYLGVSGVLLFLHSAVSYLKIEREREGVCLCMFSIPITAVPDWTFPEIGMMGRL